MVDTAESVFRDFVTDGLPASGKHNPVKQEIRELLGYYETFITAGTANPKVVYATRAALYADLAHVAGTSAWVIGDSTVAYNGVYGKAGGSGTGSWSKIADLPYGFIRLTDAGAGTANALVATSSLPLPSTPSAALLVMNVFEANTGAATLAVNGAAAKPIVTASGSPLSNGYLTSGSFIAFLDDGTNFRLLSDAASAAIQAAAEAAVLYAKEWAQSPEDDAVSVAAGGDNSTTFSALHWAAKAADYAALALNNVVVNTFTGDGSDVTFTLSAAPGSENNTLVFVGGAFQSKGTYGVSGTTLTFSEAPPNGLAIEVCYGNAVSVGTPSDATVTLAKLSSGVYASEAQARAGTATTELMTPQRTAQAIESLSPRHGQCRLVLSGLNLKLERHNGYGLIINGVMYAIPSAGVTLAPTGLTSSTAYYIYAYMNAGTMTLEWSATARATDSTTGVEIKNGDASRTLVGMWVATSATVWSTVATFGLSWFNRRPKVASNVYSTGRTTTSTTYVNINTEINVSFISWLDDAVRVDLVGSCFNSGAASNFTAVAFDNTATIEADTYNYGTAGGPVAVGFWKNGLTEAIHATHVYGRVGSGTGTWGGTASSGRCALFVTVNG